MNANELADLLETTESTNNKAATMLRQQQAEIEALKAGKIRAYDNGYEDARKHDTNNEPVAWMSNESFEVSTLNIGRFDIPLYLHPVKELTDEEIIETVKDHFIGAIKLGIVLTNDNVLEFARAILRKAQEK